MRSSGVVTHGLRELWRVGSGVVAHWLGGCGVWSSGVVVRGLQELWRVSLGVVARVMGSLRVRLD